MLKIYEAMDDGYNSSNYFGNTYVNKILNKNDLELIKDFTEIVHNNDFYFGYLIKNNKLHIFSTHAETKSEFLSFDISKIVNIYVDFNEKLPQLTFYLENREDNFFVVIEEEYEKEIILTLTNLISNHKEKTNLLKEI